MSGRVDLAAASSISSRTIKQVVAFDTPGLADGIVLYTPAVGDVIQAIGIVVATSFNGTTPNVAIGTAEATNPMEGWPVNGAPAGDTGTNGCLAFDHIDDIASGSSSLGAAATTDPIRVSVTQDGTIGGTPIDSTAGELTVYLTVGTPA